MKIPLHELLIKHRQVIAEKEKRSPVAERLLMKAFGVGASKPGLYGAGAKMASKVVRPFLKDDLIHKVADETVDGCARFPCAEQRTFPRLV